MESNIAEKELKMPFGKSVFAVLRKSALIMRSARGEASGACMEPGPALTVSLALLYSVVTSHAYG